MPVSAGTKPGECKKMIARLICHCVRAELGPARPNFIQLQVALFMVSHFRAR